MNSRVVALVRLPGNTPPADGNRGVLLRQTTLGQHPPGIFAKHYQALTRGPWGGTFPSTNSTLAKLLEVPFRSGGDLTQPSTWNTRITAVRSFVSLTADATDGYSMIPMALGRTAAEATPAIRPEQSPTKTWRRCGRDETSDLREKTLWRMLYETAARAGEVLALNVEDHGPCLVSER